MKWHRRSPSLVACLLVAMGCGSGRIDQLIQDLSSDDATIRRTSIAELAKIEAPPVRVRDACARAIHDTDRDVRRIALTTLGNNHGPEQQALLEQGLDDEELSVRMAAAYALMKVDSQHPGAIKVLRAAMKLGDGGVIVAIGREKYAWAVPTLIELLRDRRPGTRRLAAESLGQIGPAAAAALPVLQRATSDKDDRVRAAAAASKEAIERGAD